MRLETRDATLDSPPCHMNRHFALPCVLAAFGLLLANWALRSAEPTNAPPEVSAFTDKALESAVRQQVFSKRETNSPITAADVANISTIHANSRGITNLAGLEHCKAIASIDLAGNRVSDLTPLTGLKQLQYLNLATNRIKDITALGTIPALQYIELSRNQVTNLAPLAACTNLASIYASDNELTSISDITSLPRLVSLYADGNHLKSIEGVDNLKGLSSVSFSRNEISDITPLTSLRAPHFFLLETNKIRDIAPLYSACTNDDAGQRNFAPFLNLYLKGNPLSSESKKRLEQLREIGTKVNY